VCLTSRDKVSFINPYFFQITVINNNKNSNDNNFSVIIKVFLKFKILVYRGSIEMEDGGWKRGDITSDMINELHKKIWDVPRALKEA